MQGFDVITLEAQRDARGWNTHPIPYELIDKHALDNIHIVSLEPGTVRGNHAHRTLTQVIFAAAGSFMLALDDGATKQTIKMSDPSCGIILGPHLWATMSEFSKYCVILIFADDYYDESEYIRDYAEFLEAIKQDTA